MEVCDILRNRSARSVWRHFLSTLRITSLCNEEFETDTSDAFSNASGADPE